MFEHPFAPPPAPIFRPEAPEDGPAVDSLLDKAFGPGRFVKSSERVREFAQFAPETSVCAVLDGRIVGVCRMWRVRVGDEDIAFLGPLAVDPDQRNEGLGLAMVERACAKAAESGEGAVLLVGDEPYFRRLGFEVATDVVMPGPVDPARVLVRRARELKLQGPVRPRLVA